MTKVSWFLLPNDEKCIAINMEALHLGVIVLENNLYKALVRCVDQRCVQTRRSIKRPVRKIQLISSFHFIVIRKPHWSSWIHKRNPVKRSTKWPVDRCWRQTSQDVCVGDVYLTVVKWSLRIRTSSTSRCVLPAYEKRVKTRWTKNQDVEITKGTYLNAPNGPWLGHCWPRSRNICFWNR